jgi:hypothetical protein
MATPPQASVVELLQENILTTLAGLTVANGYAWDIGSVTRGHLTPLETFQFPTASLIPVQATTEIRVGVRWWEFHFNVRLWVDVDLADTGHRLEDLICDVQRILEVDSRRGGYAEYTLPTQVTYIYLESTERLAGAEVGFHADYKVSLADPRLQV